MPKQETFFEQQVGERRVEVLKSYDQCYAHEAFKNMDEQALRSLWDSLKPEEIYDPAGLPSLTDPNDQNGEAEAFLWDELLEQAREDGSLLSFFIVNETVENAGAKIVHSTPRERVLRRSKSSPPPEFKFREPLRSRRIHGTPEGCSEWRSMGVCGVRCWWRDGASER
jgi:hypothetical protein